MPIPLEKKENSHTEQRRGEKGRGKSREGRESKKPDEKAGYWGGSQQNTGIYILVSSKLVSFPYFVECCGYAHSGKVIS